MSTYTKHIAQLSVDGDWQLDFDINITTPDKISTLVENKSIINYISSPNITFVNKSGINAAKLRGNCMNNIWVDEECIWGTGSTEALPTSVYLYTNETTQEKGLADWLPLGFEGVGNVSISHDLTGTGSVNMRYSAVFSGDTEYATHTEIEFIIDIPLNTIDVSSIPVTEMDDITKRAIVEGTVAIKTKLIINEPNKTLVLTEEDSIKSWELNDERYVPDVGFIGQFVARTLNGELHNINDDFSIEDKDVELQMGIVHLGTRYQYLSTEDGRILLDEYGNKISLKELDEDETTWYSLGNFLITKPEDDEVADNTKFEAFDYTTKFNIDFNADYTNDKYTVSFNDLLVANEVVTLGWLADYVCNQTGVELANTDFTNNDFIITSNQLTSGESCRDVMKYISQLAFGWCRIGWDNKCYIDELQTISLTSSDENTITNDNYYSLTTQKNVFGPVNRIVIGMSAVDGEDVSIEDETSIDENGLTEITIMDNPFLYTNELRSSIIDSGQKLYGLYYTPLETETPGHPWFKGNELIDVQDMEGRSRPTYPFNRTINYTGHIKTKLITPAPTEQEKTTAYNKTLYKTLRDVGIKVDKQEGVINIVNSNVQAALDGLSSLENRVETEITDTYSKTQIQEIINGTAEDGTVVSSVTTTAGTFDKNGLTIEQTGSPTKTNINSNGMIISNTSAAGDGDDLLNVNSDGVDAKNVKVKQYLNIGIHSRIEDYVHTDYTEGTGVFWIGSDY